MKKILLVFFTVVLTLSLKAQEIETTTYYFIRHAEKIRTDKTNKNPELTAKGHARAQNWNTVFKNVNFDVIYSTNYKRTIQTAEPTANNKDLTIEFYSPSQLYNPEFKEKTIGKTVLIVGHSNTTPLFVNDILGEEKYKQIDDSNNANLYIVTIIENIKSSALLKIPFQI